MTLFKSNRIPTISSHTIISDNPLQPDNASASDSGNKVPNFGDGESTCHFSFSMDQLDTGHCVGPGMHQKHATFTSTSQNDLIECCGDIIVQKIITKIKKARFFSVLADETTDSSNSEQISISIRYVDKSHPHAVREDLIKFVKVIDLTACGGQVHAVRNMIGNVEETTNFARDSQKCLELLKKKIQDHSPDVTGDTLLLFSRTCWVERHEAFSRFKDLLPVVILFLEEITKLITGFSSRFNYEKVMKTAKFYASDLLGSLSELEGELSTWHLLWCNYEHKPRSAIEIIMASTTKLYPNVKTLLMLYLIGPGTTSTGE
ncbi:hypothetical protein PR048_012355 [Dryococelus australis]|uniref:DUF4371 domain-containing protein n=1 Tax=Dryococelus australis TaxID=614101 RepID=A0ABQ9HPW5_9NEOP|nr:hypothetical protein PR048_012355 [Dryococelus australis]